MGNVDERTIASFGDEWARFDQAGMTEAEARKAFEGYFAVFPWSELPSEADGFDMGCGSGRWARFVAPRVEWLNCIDPSVALDMARRNLAEFENVRFHQASLDAPTMRTDARDRFGTPLEQRFTRAQITEMMTAAGLVDLKFSDGPPFWCVVGRRAV